MMRRLWVGTGPKTLTEESGDRSRLSQNGCLDFGWAWAQNADGNDSRLLKRPAEKGSLRGWCERPRKSWDCAKVLGLRSTPAGKARPKRKFERAGCQENPLVRKVLCLQSTAFQVLPSRMKAFLLSLFVRKSPPILTLLTMTERHPEILLRELNKPSSRSKLIPDEFIKTYIVLRPLLSVVTSC